MSSTSRLPNPYRPEAASVARCLDRLQGALDWAAVMHIATPWVQAVRHNPPPFWAMESLLKEYPISSAEGLALMRLAEALLRVPDAETAIALTADQLGRADFEGSSDKVLSRLSATAIAMSKHFLPTAPEADQATQAPGLLAKLGAKTVVAATLRAVQLLGRQFVLGQTIAEGLKEAAAAQRAQPNLRYSYDMLGEGARTDADAQAHLVSYQNAIEKIAVSAIQARACEQNDGISIKLSALHPRYEDAQHARVMAELVPRVWGLCAQAARTNINLTIDAEEVDRLELSLDVFEALLAQVAQHYPNWRGFGLALQSYQLGALDLIAHVIALGRQYKLRLMCRLVKGAYWDAEVKRTQELGLPHYPVFTHKHHTDISYLACAQALLAAPDAIYPQFATHNAATAAAILHLAAAAHPVEAVAANASAVSASRFELQRLHGMGEGMYREVLQNPQVACRVYAPVGAHKDLLAYLVRRLLENGANSSFVHQLADASVPLAELLASPLHAAPQPALPLPPDLFGLQRANSAGLDLSVPELRAPLLAAYAKVAVPVVPEFDAKLASSAINISASSYKKWSKTAVSERAAMLRKAADALQAELPRFSALLVKEAFKTWADAVGEVREAIDFLRYYAWQAERIMAPQTLPGMEGNSALGVTGERNALRLTARGPWVCISPWNFPLAIFMGQVAAALATGNTVLAKPAEQTPGVAWEAVKLLIAAGVPEGALQLLHGSGDTVGAALVAAPGVAGVVFTGSTAVAKLINRALAAKDGAIVPLIAETGGINAMLVDSTALPEQVSDAVMQSAFRSAGQRCSALRLLCVHEDIADAVIAMVCGAAQELVSGDPSDLATDVGPVIDREAFDAIQTQLVRLQREARPLFGQAAPGTNNDAHEFIRNKPLELMDIAQAAIENIPNLIPPQAFEVAHISDLKAEIFGPVLHIVRWGGDPLAVIEQINTLGYGLTLGIQTRIDSRAQQLAHAAHIGNVYINRNQIGAVVGVQPFGGEGLSGTGPKAGGPHYLYRFCAEQTVTINTTAAGGNVQLMAG
ncbi:L-glutamate gamma-semialdehyde dehydrogenase [Rhodoferax sp.]|uniref:L-glutamate gamma-semialdehyde dehydrogenase n=1 Tax=Rhodoferax sp. TaxID=50421 RepID=UPI00260D9486|nr:L-glutamate gamma-semialdehyde dehydrogenase [Rhodoferax sp.]MDD5479343.1 L-glutamate gamma-semialdehyde dehydrogenase [Rhodoferax sp.]